MYIGTDRAVEVFIINLRMFAFCYYKNVIRNPNFVLRVFDYAVNEENHIYRMRVNILESSVTDVRQGYCTIMFK